VLKRVKEVGKIVDVRSQDLHLAISRLRGTVKNIQSTYVHLSHFPDIQPLTTPPASSPGMSPSLAQMVARGLPNLLRLSTTNVFRAVEEIRVAQAEFLSELNMSGDKVRAALDELSSRGKSLVGSVTASLRLH
jgi:hypothetical protein